MAFRIGKLEQRVKALNVSKQVEWPYNFLCLKLQGRWNESYKNFTLCTEM